MNHYGVFYYDYRTAYHSQPLARCQRQHPLTRIGVMAAARVTYADEANNSLQLELSDLGGANAILPSPAGPT